jgi:hypothetical protein
MRAKPKFKNKWDESNPSTATVVALVDFFKGVLK